ncbi:efflux RND transporter periplasmic adaptor subunit [Thermithiobacillus tepidarius DSM 3134]|uniref:HlyD family secretion protein n=1 Tax=Thermithiobacillus tepidarius TaxID=929 RepID=UPI000415A442|nr:efflux RND transporter periplasmic adaptor subunit [Thermithiobacillus tepidarius]
MKKRVLVIVALAVLAGIALLLWSGRFGQRQEADVITASGTVEATESQLGFQAPGRIIDLNVREGERVRAGQVLAALDAAEAGARRDQAAAQVAAAREILRELERGFRPEEIAQGRAALAAAADRLRDAQRDLARSQRLLAGGAISREAYDKTQLALQLAQSQHAQAREQLRLLESGQRRERIAAQRAQLAQAQAALRASETVLDNMVLRAPADGIVTVRHREPGETVPAGAPVLTVMAPQDRWVRIYIPENRLAAVRLGQPAAISTDTYPGRRYGGQVAFIASEAEFTPKNVQTTEERVKLVYAVKVRITDDPRFELKPGLPADVRLQP